MTEPPTAARLPEPGIRALFTQEARWQAWLDVEAALARAEATLGMIPEAASVEIGRRSRLELFDLERVREGLARTGHPLVPLIWELDRICEGDAGGYAHWGATTQNITQTGEVLQIRGASGVPGSVATGAVGVGEAGGANGRLCAARSNARTACGAGDVRDEGGGLDR